MILVTLAWRTGVTRDVLLAGVPRVGETVRMSRNGRGDPALIVEHVLWMEGNEGAPEPSVVCTVRQRDEGLG